MSDSSASSSLPPSTSTSSVPCPPDAPVKAGSTLSAFSERLNAVKFWCFMLGNWVLVMICLYYCVRLMVSTTIVMLTIFTGGVMKEAVASAMSMAGFAAFAAGAFLLFLTAWSFSLMVDQNRNSKSTALDLQVPSKRNYHFAFAVDKISSWHGAGFLITSFWNAMSIFFPSGERMFIEAVRAHKHIIEKEQTAKGGNEKLLQCVDAFISQEGVHGREHECYNEILMDKYPAVRWLERLVIFITEGITKYAPQRLALSATIALEHWTALLAGLLLNHRHSALSPNDVADEDGYALIWKWHGMEEVEHRAVAYDVWLKSYPNTFYYYISRCISQIIVTAIFWSLILSYFLILVLSESPRYFLLFPEWIDFFYFQFRKPGIYSKILPHYLDYFRRDFHPSQQNNEKYEKLYEELKDKVEKFHQTGKTYQAKAEVQK